MVEIVDSVKGDIRLIKIGPASDMVIKDGTWYDSLYKLTWHFFSKEKFIDYVRQVRGSDMKDRMEMAGKAYDAIEKYRAKVA